MNISSYSIYKISYNITSLLNIYLNGLEKRFPLKYFSFFQFRSIPKTQIIDIIKNLLIIIKKDNLQKFFKIDLNKSIEENILTIIKNYQFFISQASKGFKIENVKVNELKPVNFNNLYGISGEEKELIRLIQTLFQFKKYFKLILLNGSIGSRDYKPGWSDIDLFIIIKNKYLNSIENLRKLRRIALTINKLLMKYCIFQYHKVIYSSEYHIQANYNEFFPISCLETGQIITEMENLQFRIPPQEHSALNYFKSIYLSSKNLFFKSKIKELDIFSQVLFFHRIFSFPFSFLQCFNINIGKKNSFHKLKTEFKNIFLEISEFYNQANKFYLEWKIKKLCTYKIRKLLSSIISINYLNKIFVKNEKYIIKRIKKYYNKFSKNGIFNQYNKYLDLANDYLESHYPIYINPHRPYLKRKFYEYCIEKVNRIFSGFDDITSIYQFGTVSAPGNSDIDLMFVVKNNKNIFDKYYNAFKTQFTPNEQYIVFKHHPTVISENIASYINYLLPYKNISKIYGKDIKFREISNPYIKFGLLVELLIYISPKKLPLKINQPEDLRTHLQVIKSISYTIDLFIEISQKFNLKSRINFEEIQSIFKINDFIRKNSFLININILKSHIKNAFLRLNKLLYKLRCEIAHFIEKNVLKKIVLPYKKSIPILKIGNYFFVANEKKRLKINKFQRHLTQANELYRLYYYYPWSFYFFFKHQNFLKKEFFEGVSERNYYLMKYLKFITSYNNGKTEYAPFWYWDKQKFLLYTVSQKLWKILPKPLQDKFIFYYYFMKAFRKFNYIVEKINNNNFKKIISKILRFVNL